MSRSHGEEAAFEANVIPKRVTGSAGAGLLGASVVSSGCGHPPNRQTETNVVVVMVDSLRQDHVGAYGNPRIMCSRP